MNHAARLLFDLLGGRTVEGSEADWAFGAEMAADHRLEPWLHGVRGGCDTVPAFLLKRWEDAYRDAALSALAHERTLLRITGSLETEIVVLKGGWLGRYVYDHAALRPVRDLDLLLKPDEVVAAWNALQKQGFTPAEPLELPASEWARRYKHLPALRGSQGVLVELHSRLWDEGPGAPRHPSDLFERAGPDPRHPALLALHPTDMLMHGAVHGVWTHRWDNGPLALIDLMLVCQRLQPDWNDVRQRAETQGWDRMLALQLAAADRWLELGLSQQSSCCLDVPLSLVESAAPMMTAPSAMREHDRSARRLTASPKGRTRAFGTRLKRLQQPRTAADWLMEQARGWWTVRRDREAAARLAANRAMEDWLAG